MLKILKKKETKLLIALSLTLLVSGCAKKEMGELENKANSPKEEIKKEVFYAPLSGVETQEDIKGEPIFAVMLDNHPDAIPQSGLKDAEVIYEFKAEGEFTRFMALFQKNKVDVLGPVRSARPYFVDTAKEYNAIYAHWGGSEAGYAEIPTVGVNDLDGIRLEGTTFYRNKEVKKKRPHNGYTNYSLMYDKSKELGYLESKDFKSNLKFDTTKDLEELQKQMGDRKCHKISLDFFKHYNMTFEYDENKNIYTPIRNGEIVVDERDNTNLEVNNLIVQFAKSYVSGPLGTLTVEHIGNGQGYLISNGKIIEIEYEKNDRAKETTFKTKDGDKIVLNPGLTMIEVLDDPSNVLIEPQEEVSEENTENSVNNQEKKLGIIKMKIHKLR